MEKALRRWQAHNLAKSEWELANLRAGLGSFRKEHGLREVSRKTENNAVVLGRECVNERKYLGADCDRYVILY